MNDIILLAGIMSTPLVWAAQVQALAQSGLEQTRILSIAPPARDSLGAIAEEILAEAPARFALIGHSLGGYVALEIAARGPERLSGLGLLSSSPLADTPEVKAGRAKIIAAAEDGRFEQVAARIIGVLTTPDDLRGPLRAPLEAMAAESGAAAFIAHQTAAMNRSDFTGMLGSIACPTLIMYGSEDPIVPPAGSRLMHKCVTDSQLIDLPKAGHILMLEEPDAVSAALVEFLVDRVADAVVDYG